MTMNWFTRSRQRCLGLLAVIALALACTLAACGSPANASNSGTPTNNAVNTQPQQHQQQPSNSGPATQNTSSSAGSSNVQNTDQQIQSLLRQLDGSQNDASNADAGASQDSGQP